MNDLKEARARIAIAELEQKQQQRRAETRAAKWRLALSVLRMLFLAAIGLYVLESHWQASISQLGGFFLAFLAITVWKEHQTDERIRALHTEVERLKADLHKGSA